MNRGEATQRICCLSILIPVERCTERHGYLSGIVASRFSLNLHTQMERLSTFIF